MIIRIVKMTFEKEKTDAFLENFTAYKTKIKHFPGCMHLELWKNADEHHIYYTYSYWNSKDDLENYRKSDLFAEVWGKTKIHFSAKPEAVSIKREIIV